MDSSREYVLHLPFHTDLNLHLMPRPTWIFACLSFSCCSFFLLSLIWKTSRSEKCQVKTMLFLWKWKKCKQTPFAWKRKEFIWMGAIMLHLQKKKVERGHLDGSSWLRWQQTPFAWKWKEVLCRGMGAVAWDERGHYSVEHHSQSWDLDNIKVHHKNKDK